MRTKKVPHHMRADLIGTQMDMEPVCQHTRKCRQCDGWHAWIPGLLFITDTVSGSLEMYSDLGRRTPKRTPLPHPHAPHRTMWPRVVLRFMFLFERTGTPILAVQCSTFRRTE